MHVTKTVGLLVFDSNQWPLKGDIFSLCKNQVVFSRKKLQLAAFQLLLQLVDPMTNHRPCPGHNFVTGTNGPRADVDTDHGTMEYRSKSLKNVCFS